ncbi:helix-turn-helix domain-containing protein [Alistipes finegoldii]|uniref:helix-turn-helix domain-containing protein n=1 Tax=Alistipes finegoldii TaxID=214856 RepID=UPI003AB50F34
MAKDKILCDNSVITRDTPEYRELIATMRDTVKVADRLMKEVRPCLLNERYFTTEQVMDLFHISRRALQNYRDKGIIPFVSVGGNILYSETKINEMLGKNYYRN